MKKSPIFFYKIVPNGADGTLGNNGDIHYCCLHSSHKVCMIKKLMRSNLNGNLMDSLVVFTDQLFS